jgi:hypothetical protein
MGGPDPEINSRTKFMMRCKILKITAHQLAKFHDTNVYLVIDHPRESYAYNSADDNAWPPPDEEIGGVTRTTEGSIKLGDRNIIILIYTGKISAKYNAY